MKKVYKNIDMISSSFSVTVLFYFSITVFVQKMLRMNTMNLHISVEYTDNLNSQVGRAVLY